MLLKEQNPFAVSPLIIPRIPARGIPLAAVELPPGVDAVTDSEIDKVVYALYDLTPDESVVVEEECGG